jgi:hypothetical protein
MLCSSQSKVTLILVNAIDSTRNYGWSGAHMLCCNQYSQSKIVVVIIFWNKLNIGLLTEETLLSASILFVNKCILFVKKKKTNIFIDICKSISKILIQHLETNQKDHQEIAQKKFQKLDDYIKKVDQQKYSFKKRLPTYKSIKCNSYISLHLTEMFSWNKSTGEGKVILKSWSKSFHKKLIRKEPSPQGKSHDHTH